MISAKINLLRSNTLKAALLLLISVVLVSCETVAYYSQAVRGQFAIVFSREDIQQLLQQEDLPIETAAKFKKILEIRDFAEQELLLPVGKHYSSYVDIKREHVVWNVFAAPEFSTNPINWCYPIAGCVSYRGYFSEQLARRYAERLQRDGYDVYVGGVDAYSTLGWFEDSVLSPVLTRLDYQLAGLIFHELAHQLVYVPGDTTFNEGFATAVEREGVRRWLMKINEVASIDAAMHEHERQQQFVDLVSQYRDNFENLYQQEISLELMRSQKFQLQQSLRAEYENLKQQWLGYAGYDRWFSRSLNNAQLSALASYNDLLPSFANLFAQSGSDFSSFYAQVKRIAELSKEEREQLLAVPD